MSDQTQISAKNEVNILTFSFVRWKFCFVKNLFRKMDQNSILHRLNFLTGWTNVNVSEANNDWILNIKFTSTTWYITDTWCQWCEIGNEGIIYWRRLVVGIITWSYDRNWLLRVVSYLPNIFILLGGRCSAGNPISTVNLNEQNRPTNSKKYVKYFWLVFLCRA